MKKIFLVIISIIIILILLSGCNNKVIEKIKKDEKIIIGISLDAPPFSYIDDDYKMAGLEYEIIVKIMNNQSLEYEIKDIYYGTAIEKLLNEEVDIIVTELIITEERQEQFDFSNPYYDLDQRILSLKTSNVFISDNSDISQLKIGAYIASRGEDWVLDNLIYTGLMPENNFIKFNYHYRMLEDLNDNDVDVIIVDKTISEAYLEEYDLKNVYPISTGEKYGFGIRKGNQMILNKLNQGLQDLKSSDEWNSLILKYFE